MINNQEFISRWEGAMLISIDKKEQELIVKRLEALRSLDSKEIT